MAVEVMDSRLEGEEESAGRGRDGRLCSEVERARNDSKDTSAAILLQQQFDRPEQQVV